MSLQGLQALVFDFLATHSVIIEMLSHRLVPDDVFPSGSNLGSEVALSVRRNLVLLPYLLSIEPLEDLLSLVLVLG